MPKKKSTSRRRRDDYDDEEEDGRLSQETKNGIYGVVTIGIAILLVLAFLDMAGTAGVWFQTISVKLLGWGAYALPIAFGVLGASFFRSIDREIPPRTIIGTVLFMSGLLGLFYILGNDTHTIKEGIEHGGYLGIVFGYPLLTYAGFWAGLIIVILISIVSAMVALDISIHQLLLNREQEEDDDEEYEDDKEYDDEEDDDEDDSVVIKRGEEVLDAKAQAKAEQAAVAAEARRIAAKAKEADNAFVIKSSRSRKWALPPLDLLHADSEQPRPGDINANVAIIKRTLANFGITVEMGEVSIGPAVTQFTLRPAVGVKLARIVALQKDLALALAASSIRIEAPIPGKALVGIEIPNAKSAVVGLRDLLESKDFKKSAYAMPLAIGRDVSGYPVIAPLEKLPHMLIAGSTGSGKSVTINSILLSLLYRHSPDMLKLILVDPKRVELTLYNEIPHLITPVIVDTKKVIHALRWAVKEMERRYEKLSAEGSRDINSYNTKRQEAKEPLMPFIVIVIDELADLMAQHGRDVEAAVVRLAQMARAVGIHLIVSTQRPSVEVITGLIKANVPARMALRVASQIDSRTILDGAGAEKLLGNGDMLYLAGNINANMTRVQGTFVTEREVKDVVKFILDQADEMEQDEQDVELTSGIETAVSGGGYGGGDDDDVDDDMYPEAKQVVIEAGKASASYLQRRLKVGYARAARLLDILEEKGIIGPGEGAKPREVYVKADGSTDNPNNDMPDGSIEDENIGNADEPDQDYEDKVDDVENNEEYEDEER